MIAEKNVNSLSGVQKQEFMNKSLNNAALLNNEEMVWWFLDRGADPSNKNFFVLQQAMKRKQYKLIKKLLPLFQEAIKDK